MPAIRFNEDARFSDDPAIIGGWAAEALAANLCREDGIARFSLADPASIESMAYLPGIAWVLYGPQITDESGRRRARRWQAFTRADRRGEGIGSRLYAYARGHREARGQEV